MRSDDAQPGGPDREYHLRMNDPLRHRCSHCGAALDAEKSGGFCAACLFAEALDGGAAGIGGCEIVEELGRGGMGVVYRARQHGPRREVALKLLEGPAALSAAARERFRIEAAAMARLEHPGILPVYAFGEQDGVPFFTMKLAAGGTLRERRGDYAGRWRRTAELMAALADAVQFAHGRGVLHRDLKPANVLFDDDGRAYVADFGLAKIADDSSGLTLSQTMLGTPGYLAPELAGGGVAAATTASDVWALGAMLYELLAQRPPFEAAAVPALLRKICEENPAALPADVPRDAGVIALKALAKDPARRYASAGALAEDLRNWLAGRPIAARPPSRMERTGVWLRRNPALAAALALLFVALAWFSVAQWRANVATRLALAETELREARLLRGSGVAGQRHEALARLAEAARALPPERRAELRSEAAAALALPDLRPLASWPVPVLDSAGVEDFSPDLAHYAAAREGGGAALYETASRLAVSEWPDAAGGAAKDFAFDPHGRWLAARSQDGAWDLLPRAGGERRRFPSQVQFTADGVLAVRDSALVFDAMNGGAAREVVRASIYAEPLLSDAKGERVLHFKGLEPEAFVVRVSDGARLCQLAHAAHRVTAAEWSPDGRLIALADGLPPFTVRVFDAATGVLAAAFSDHQMPVRKLHFHPGGASLATVADDQKLVWREIEAGGFRLEMEAAERALRFDKSGTRLGYAPADGQLGILEAAVPAAFHAWPEPRRDLDGAAYSAALSPDGRWLAVMHDKSLRIWDAVAMRETARHEFAAERTWWGTAFFSPQQPDELTWSALGCGVWRGRIDETGALRDARALGGPAEAMVQEFAPDGGGIVVGFREKEISAARLWPGGDPTRAVPLADGGRFNGFRLLPDGTGVSAHFADPDITLWRDGKKQRALGLAEPVSCETSPDGRWLLAGTKSEMTLWRTADWTIAARWPARPGQRDAWAAAFSPDAQLLAQADPAGRVTLRAVPSGEEILTLPPPRTLRVQRLLFTPRETLLLTAGDGRTFEWHLAALRRECTALGLGW